MTQKADFGDDDLELTFSSRVGRSSSVLPSYDNSFQVELSFQHLLTLG